MENPLHGGSVDTAPPPPPRAGGGGGGGRDAPQASAFAAVHARSMPAAPASPGALLRALGGGVPGAAAGVRVAQSRDYHLEPAVRGPGEEGEKGRGPPRADAVRCLPEQVLIPTNMMGRVEGHAVDVNAVADLVKVERALVARSGAVMNGHGGTEPPGVLLQGGASVVKQVNGRPGGRGPGPPDASANARAPAGVGLGRGFHGEEPGAGEAGRGGR